MLTGHISRQQQKGKVAGQNRKQEVSLDSKYGDARTPDGSTEAFQIWQGFNRIARTGLDDNWIFGYWLRALQNRQQGSLLTPYKGKRGHFEEAAGQSGRCGVSRSYFQIRKFLFPSFQVAGDQITEYHTFLPKSIWEGFKKEREVPWLHI